MFEELSKMGGKNFRKRRWISNEKSDLRGAEVNGHSVIGL
jgi:hypothetical protein